MTGIPCFWANSFTGGGVMMPFLPTGQSGLHTTATGTCPASKSPRRTISANRGEPKKIKLFWLDGEDIFRFISKQYPVQRIRLVLKYAGKQALGFYPDRSALFIKPLKNDTFGAIDRTVRMRNEIGRASCRERV